MFLEICDHERRHVKCCESGASPVVTSFIYSSIICMEQQPSQMQFVAPFIFKQPTRVFAELIWPKPAPAYLLNSYVLHCNSSLCSTEAALCSVKRQGLKFLLRFLTIKELMHNIRAQTSQPKPAKLHCSGCHSPHLRAACEQNLS